RTGREVSVASRRKATIELADHSYERVIAGELHRLAVIAPPWAAWLLTVLVGVGLHLAWPGWIAAVAVAAGGAGLAAQAWHLSRERKTLLGRCLAPVSCVAGFGWMALVVWAGPTRALLGVWFIGGMFVCGSWTHWLHIRTGSEPGLESLFGAHAEKTALAGGKVLKLKVSENKAEATAQLLPGEHVAADAVKAAPYLESAAHYPPG